MNTATKVVMSATVALGIGGVAGYYFAKHELKNAFDTDLENAVEEVKDYYRLLRKTDYDTVEEASAAFIPKEKKPGSSLVADAKRQSADIIAQMQYGEKIVEDAEKELEAVVEGLEEVQAEVVKNIFDERLLRSPDRAYLITDEEFFDDYVDEEGRVYDKITLNWFEGDSTLADDDEQMIPEVDRIVGLDNMSRFGEGEDSMILHIRNEKLRADYEVSKDEREYSEVVLGADAYAKLDEDPRVKPRAKRKKLEE